MKDLMKRKTKIALVLCLPVLGMAIEARADEARAGCQHVRGGVTSTVIPSPNDPFGRALNNVDGVLNGASTALITGFGQAPAPFIVLTATSFEVFVTNGGDMLTATGAVTLTPIPGKPPGEFTENATLTVTGGSGKYAGATGTITLAGLAHHLFGPGLTTFNVIYQGSVCGPNVKDDKD
jgi:hypothetical protein